MAGQAGYDVRVTRMSDHNAREARPLRVCQDGHVTKPLPALATIVARLDALENRVRDIEGGYGETLYRQHRKIIGLELNMGRLMDHFGLPRATDIEIDTVLDEQT